MENQLRQITKEELDNILEQHKLWLETRFSDDVKGQCVDLRYADLSSVDLRDADLSGVDLSYADLSDADLSNADLSGVDLRYADLRFANLHYADLLGVDLNYANLNFSCFPLWRGGLNVHIDDRQAIQLLYHLVQNVQFSKNTTQELKALLLQPQIVDKANEYHRALEYGKIELKEEEEQ